MNQRHEYWMPLSVFCEKHDVKAITFYKYKLEDRIPKSTYRKSTIGGAQVNEKYFIRRSDFKQKLRMRSQDLYWKLIEIYGSESAIGRLLSTLSGDSVGTWVTYMNQGLWVLPTSNIISIRPNERMYLFYRYGRWLLAINKRYRRRIRRHR